MSDADRFDCIVVGAGMAGCAAAITAARAGLATLLLERGETPGEKNVSGGAFYGPALKDLLGDAWKDAPIERTITERRITFLTEDAATTLQFKDGSAFEDPPGFTVLRSKFDAWLAARAEEAGAEVFGGVHVDELVRTDGRITGIRTGEDVFEADVVIVADGANSKLAEKAGLRGEISARQMAQGVKEVIRLPRETLEARFDLSGKRGVANEMVGWCTRGLPGGAFLYTNEETVSLGVVVTLDGFIHGPGVPTYELLQDLKKHPYVRDLIDGGETVEYAAHLVPEGGLAMMPEIVGDGVLICGDAAGFLCNTGKSIEGMNHAVVSGRLAAETVVEAHEKKAGFDRNALASYRTRLENSPVLQDLRTFRNAPGFFENPRLFADYPDLVNGILRRTFSADGAARPLTAKVVREEMKKSGLGLWTIGRDLFRGRKAL